MWLLVVNKKAGKRKALPLVRHFSTLFYRPEAANLGDLMRFVVRPGVRIELLLRFSRVVSFAPDTAYGAVLCLPWGRSSG